MPGRIADIWVYLSASPLLGLTITLLAYQAAYGLHRRANYNPLVNPVAIAVAMLVLALHLTETPYAQYFEGAQFVHFLLGPATVALAVPLYAQWQRLRSAVMPLFAALLAGSVVAAGSAVALGWLLGASDTTVRALAPKSVTAPIAMGIAEKIGGIPSLTAVLVILTGITGASLAKWVLDALRIEDHAVRGFAVGLAAHGIGTARAFQVSEEAGAFAGLAMGLNGLLTAVLLPLMFAVWRNF